MASSQKNWTPNEKRAWSTRLWFAKEFGWSEEDLEKISASYGKNLIKINNMEIAEAELKAKTASNKRSKR